MGNARHDLVFNERMDGDMMINNHRRHKKYKKGRKNQKNRKGLLTPPSIKIVSLPDVQPKTPIQDVYLRYLRNFAYPIVVGYGPSGVGKTLLACHVAIEKLYQNQVDKIVIAWPEISVEEQHGFLGTKSFLDIFYRYFTPEEVNILIQHKVIEICPLAHMRGRTFTRSFIIADEMQHSTPDQMKMLLTRIGHHSKLVVIGDVRRVVPGDVRLVVPGDVRLVDAENLNGLEDFIGKFQNSTNGELDQQIGLVRFTEKDIERHPVIKPILDLYNK